MSDKPAVIFLDFDGVLHPTNYLRFTETNGELVLQNDARFCWAAELWELIKDVDCDLIIHSSWRTSYSLAEIKAMLPSPLARRIRGTTGAGNRFDSIVRYAEEHRLANFLILDDAADEFPSGLDSLVVCDGKFGITGPVVKQRVREFLRSVCLT